MENVYDHHCQFLAEVLEASKFDTKTVSALPTLVFLVGSFLVCHNVLHRRTNPRTPLKLRLYRETGFQLTYFYVVRLWFVCLNVLKWANACALDHLEDLDGQKERLLWLNSMQVRSVIYSALICTSLAPLVILTMNSLWRHSIPNFLLWVGEDPWARSEIGISGHYLERPPNFVLPRRKEVAYRTRRSISYEDPTPRPRTRQPPRACRSQEIPAGPIHFLAVSSNSAR